MNDGVGQIDSGRTVLALPAAEEGELVVVRRGEGEPVRARVEARSVIAVDATGVPWGRGVDEPGLGRVVWSGSFAETEGGGPLDEDPRTWGPRGWGALEGAMGRVVLPMVARGVRVWVRAHARHVVSDVPGCKRVLETFGGAAGVGVAVDAVAMMTEGMRRPGVVEDLVRRVYEAVEGLVTVAGPGRVLVIVRPMEGVDVCGMVDGLPRGVVVVEGRGAG